MHDFTLRCMSPREHAAACREAVQRLQEPIHPNDAVGRVPIQAHLNRLLTGRLPDPIVAPRRWIVEGDAMLATAWLN